jgi:glycerophosphoryl diester phosphodiesterase
MTPNTAWPYPFWIAHRGAGVLAPENTLSAFDLGLQLGYRMFECDVRLSRDQVPFLLHDDSLKRTTGVDGLASQFNWADLQALDAGSWHSATYPDAVIPSLHAVLQWCASKPGAFLNLELKPNSLESGRTGELVGKAVQIWTAQHPSMMRPLLSSFDQAALRSAQLAAGEIPRALLLAQAGPEWLEQAMASKCVAVIGHYNMWTEFLIQTAQTAGLRCVGYTVNSIDKARKLIDWGIDSLITDRLDLFNPWGPEHTLPIGRN